MSATPEYFRQQVAELWQRIGLKSFWANPEAPALAVKALGHVYLQMEPPPTERERQWLETAIGEIERRSAMLWRIPQPRQGGEP